jgi:hypothetical protein
MFVYYLGTVWCIVLFILVLLISGCCYYLDVVNFGNLQDLQEEDFEQLQAGEQGKCSLTILILYSFSH